MMLPNLPTPDTTSQPSYSSENVLEIIFSSSKERRAVITQDRNSCYRVHTDYWCLSDFDFIGIGYWSAEDKFAILTESMESALKLAREALQESETI